MKHFLLSHLAVVCDAALGVGAALAIIQLVQWGAVISAVTSFLARRVNVSVGVRRLVCRRSASFP
jgi:hypothetical protein